MDKTAQHVKETIFDWMDETAFPSDDTAPFIGLTRGQKGAVIGLLNKYCGGDESRRLVLGWLFSPNDIVSERSTTELTDVEWYTLWQWVGFWQDDASVWHARQGFDQELLAVLSETMRAYSKMKVSERKELPKPPEDVRTAVADLGGEIVETSGKVGIKNLDQARGLIGRTGLYEAISPEIRKKLKEI